MLLPWLWLPFEDVVAKRPTGIPGLKVICPEPTGKVCVWLPSEEIEWLWLLTVWLWLPALLVPPCVCDAEPPVTSAGHLPCRH